mmetsp:Transcript_54414/g.100533  ORF Transcript_54414/g.100533 Transcript_54414/m.100533 type:complete len:345 (+) Transcript_54414:566-1600(+)
MHSKSSRVSFRSQRGLHCASTTSAPIRTCSALHPRIPMSCNAFCNRDADKSLVGRSPRRCSACIPCETLPYFSQSCRLSLSKEVRGIQVLSCLVKISLVIVHSTTPCKSTATAVTSLSSRSCWSSANNFQIRRAFRSFTAMLCANVWNSGQPIPTCSNVTLSKAASGDPNKSTNLPTKRSSEMSGPTSVNNESNKHGKSTRSVLVSTTLAYSCSASSKLKRRELHNSSHSSWVNWNFKSLSMASSEASACFAGTAIWANLHICRMSRLSARHSLSEAHLICLRRSRRERSCRICSRTAWITRSGFRARCGLVLRRTASLASGLTPTAASLHRNSHSSASTPVGG